MINICFICHGNICRSPMAEFIMKKLVKDNNLEKQIKIDSKATSSEALGCDTHYMTKEYLDKNNIPYKKRAATRISPNDYEKYDYIICMDQNNINNLLKIINDKDNKVSKLLEYTTLNKDIADPWYTGDFKTTYEDIYLGCEKLLEYIKKCYNM